MKKRSIIYLMIIVFIFCTGYTNNPFYKIKEKKLVENEEYKEYIKLTDEEKQKRTIIPREKYDKFEYTNNNKFNFFNVTVYPTTYDLRNVSGTNYAPDLRDQGTYGLCWAFSANSILESTMKKKELGNFNFSERQIDYALTTDDVFTTYVYDSKYRKIVGSSNRSLHEGGNAQLVGELWKTGISPVYENSFSSYYTNSRQSLDSVYSNKNVDYDVLDVIEFPWFDFYDYEENELDVALNSFNNTIKSHIINYGAVASAVYWDYYNESSNLVYQESECETDECWISGHAGTIIGWNDTYADIDNDGINEGAWLVQNSWGNTNSYYYVSYYDITITSNMMGIRDVEQKKWDHSYDNYNSPPLLYQDNNVFVYNKTSNIEELYSIKIRPLSYIDTELTLYLSTTGFYEDKIELGTYTIDDNGYTTIKFDNTYELPNEAFVIYIKTQYSFDLSVFTKDKEDTSNIQFNPINYRNVCGTSYNLMIRSNDIPNGEQYNILIKDDDNNDITNNFILYDNYVLNDNVNIFIRPVQNYRLPDRVIVDVNYGDTTKTIIFLTNVWDGGGTKYHPYVIYDVNDLTEIYDSGDNNYLYYKLGNSIDINPIIRNNQTWEPIDFFGEFDGNGYYIMGLYSDVGGLFGNVRDSNIKNLGINKSFVGSYSSDPIGILANNVVNTKISNVSITNNNEIYGEVAGGVIGEGTNIQINNTHSNASVYGNNIAGGIVGIANFVSNSDLNSSNPFITLDKVYYYGTLMVPNDNTNYAGGIIGKIYYNQKETPTTKISLTSNYYHIKEVDIEEIEEKYPNNYYGYLDSNLPGEERIEINNVALKTDEEMKIESTYTNFDFTNVWSYVTDNLPNLKLFDWINSLPSIKSKLIYTGIKYDETSKYIYAKENEGYWDYFGYINYDISYEIYDGTSTGNSEFFKTGEIVTFSNEYDSDAYTVVIPGDVTGDGIINIVDVVKIANHTIEGNILNYDYYLEASDVTKDDNTNIVDVVKIANYILDNSIDIWR